MVALLYGWEPEGSGQTGKSPSLDDNCRFFHFAKPQQAPRLLLTVHTPSQDTLALAAEARPGLMRWEPQQDALPPAARFPLYSW